MICEICKPLLSEYTDGRLNSLQRRDIEMHLDRCPKCAALMGDFRAMGGLLRGLPTAQTSSHFEARLAERLARARPPQASWLSRLTASLRPTPSLWRPALAFGAAAAAFVGVLSFQHTGTVTNDPPLAMEGSLVTQCVQQHRNYVGAQPLSDPAAQNLASHLDETASALPAPLPGENDL